MNDLLNCNNETEKYISNIVKYIEELINEFGIMHPLVAKTIKELVDYMKLSVDNGFHFSENFSTGLSRYFERWQARSDKIIEEQQRLAEKKSNESWLVCLLLCIFTFGIGLVLYQCFRKKDPAQVLHHHSGSITDNININHSGYVTENINLRLNKF